MSSDSDRFSHCQLLPDKCLFQTGIGAFWQFQRVFFPRTRENRSIRKPSFYPLNYRNKYKGPDADFSVSGGSSKSTLRRMAPPSGGDLTVQRNIQCARKSRITAPISFA
jgi:hypothetical protein